MRPGTHECSVCGGLYGGPNWPKWCRCGPPITEHIAIVFGFIGHLYAIKCASEWSRESPKFMKDAWWALMDTWSLATFGRIQPRPRYE